MASALPRTVLITGAASGLGLGLVRHYANEPNTRVIALDRNSHYPAAEESHVEWHMVDVVSVDSIRAFVKQLPTSLEINLLIHSAGVRGLNTSHENAVAGDTASAETLGATTADLLLSTLHINAVGSFNLISELMPLLRRPTDHSKVMVMGSRMGSIGGNESAGGGYAYRASKAAQNAIIQCFRCEVPDVTFVIIHPGRVETGLVDFREEGAVSVEACLQDLIPLIEKCGRDDNGAFLDRFGKLIPW